mgnify:CR=1 FL=1
MKQIEQLYLQYKQDVYAYLLSLTRELDMAEELLSETFVRAILSIENFKGKSSVKTWLFSIARNVWLEKLRKEKQTVEFTDLLGLYISDRMEERMTAKETAEKIRQLLLQKEERTRKVVYMRAEGYSFFEIAKALNISENSARVIDFRARNWLKTMLEKEGLS